jgi:hypothetical protein
VLLETQVSVDLKLLPFIGACSFALKILFLYHNFRCSHLSIASLHCELFWAIRLAQLHA